MKKTITTITLAIVMMFGATFANAGILVSDRQAPAAECGEASKDGIIVFGRDGIIVFGFVIIGNPTKDTKPCTTEAGKDGIIVFG